MVLLKGVDERGFVFYTNLGSPKAAALAENPRAELCFFWAPKRQVRVRGKVAPVSAEEADAYFATRPRISQLGAWASKQSQPLTRYADLERAVAGFALRFGTGSVPRPDHWSGFRLAPEQIEFWEQMPFRLHRRSIFTREGDSWREQGIFP
jgi:pyridoxamine 5'-phosphate oxidase